jgi:inorganic pyrophosphatase
MDKKVVVYIEIEQHSNQKYEVDKTTDQLVLDRVLPYPYYYPYSYGFVENTIAMDADELDALIITNDKIERGNKYTVYIIGVLIMEDENGLDEKIICVLEKDYQYINELSHLPKETLDNIHWFFSNYKTKTLDKWSNVFGYKNKQCAIELCNSYTKI